MLAAGAEVTDAEAQVLTMSTLTEENVMAVKVAACERLLAARVEMKMQVRLPISISYAGLPDIWATHPFGLGALLGMQLCEVPIIRIARETAIYHIKRTSNMHADCCMPVHQSQSLNAHEHLLKPGTWTWGAGQAHQ